MLVVIRLYEIDFHLYVAELLVIISFNIKPSCDYSSVIPRDARLESSVI